MEALVRSRKACSGDKVGMPHGGGRRRSGRAHPLQEISPSPAQAGCALSDVRAVDRAVTWLCSRAVLIAEVDERRLVRALRMRRVASSLACALGSGRSALCMDGEKTLAVGPQWWHWGTIGCWWSRTPVGHGASQARARQSSESLNQRKLWRGRRYSSRKGVLGLSKPSPLTRWLRMQILVVVSGRGNTRLAGGHDRGHQRLRYELDVQLKTLSSGDPVRRSRDRGSTRTVQDPWSGHRRVSTLTRPGTVVAMPKLEHRRQAKLYPRIRRRSRPKTGWRWAMGREVYQKVHRESGSPEGARLKVGCRSWWGASFHQAAHGATRSLWWWIGRREKATFDEAGHSCGGRQGARTRAVRVNNEHASCPPNRKVWAHPTEGVLVRPMLSVLTRRPARRTWRNVLLAFRPRTTGVKIPPGEPRKRELGARFFRGRCAT